MLAILRKRDGTDDQLYCTTGRLMFCPAPIMVQNLTIILQGTSISPEITYYSHNFVLLLYSQINLINYTKLHDCEYQAIYVT